MDTFELNPYAVAYIFRVWHTMEPHHIADDLCCSEQDVWNMFHTYYERVSSWLKTKGRYPSTEDIDNGDFTLEPFDCLHYKRYIQDV